MVIGRFQPLHDDHVRLIRTAIQPGSITLILIGCSESDGKSDKNPFTFEERKNIIETEFISEIMKGTFFVHRLDDNPSDEEWLLSVGKIADQYIGCNPPTIFVVDKDEPTTASNNLLAKYFGIKRITSQSSTLSATSVRALLSLGIISKDIPLSTRNFLLEKYKHVYTTDEKQCRACGVGLLAIKSELRSFTYQQVYQLQARASFLTCNVCGASIIPKASRLDYKKNKQQAIDRLYYN